MLTTNTRPPKQVLLRLPDDVAAKLARAVAPRKRNQFLIDLVRRELDKEDQALIDACESLNRMEAASPALRAQATEWLEADLVASLDESDSDFDAKAFSREAAQARALLARKPQPKRRRA
jgi:serine/threonine protein kinase